MTTLLKNIEIHEITLCKAGKNGLQFIAKSEDGGPRIVVPITKTDAAQQIAVGIVYEPERPDADDEMATTEEIQKAAWSALKNHALVNKAHGETATAGAYLAESYIAKAGDPDGFTQGAWAVVVKVEDPALWKQIESGELAAFSMGGLAQKEPVGKETPDDAVEKEVSIDSMVYATGLKDVLAVVNGIAANLGDVVKDVGEIVKATRGEQAQLGEKLEAVTKAVDDVSATVRKIAETTTDGRVSSAEPGTEQVDPARY